MSLASRLFQVMGLAMLLAFTCLLVSDVDAAGDEKAVRFTAPKFDGKQSSWAVWFAMFKSFLTLTCVAAFQLLDRPPVLTTRDAVAASEGNPAIPAVTAEDITRNGGHFQRSSRRLGPSRRLG